MIAFAAKAVQPHRTAIARTAVCDGPVNHLAKPGLDLRKGIRFVRDDVLKATNNTQEPFIYGSLGGNDVPCTGRPVYQPPVDQDAPMHGINELALQLATKAGLDSFINKYPTGILYRPRQSTARQARGGSRAHRSNHKAKPRWKTVTACHRRCQAADRRRLRASQGRERARIAAELAKKAEEAKVAEASV